MSKRLAFTTITPLPASTTRRTAISHLHDHLALIDLNPLVQSRNHLLSPPAHAAPDELQCTWFALTDRPVPGLPSPAPYTAAFQNLPNGVWTHAYAPMGRDVRETWTIGGTLPGEAAVPGVVEPGVDVPSEGLYLRQDVEARCNVLVAGFVRKTLKKTQAALVERIGGAGDGAEAPRPPSPIDAFRHFANDETFLGPQRQPTGTGSDFFFFGRPVTDSTAPAIDVPPPPAFLRAPSPPTRRAPSPPTRRAPSPPTRKAPSPPTRRAPSPPTRRAPSPPTEGEPSSQTRRAPSLTTKSPPTPPTFLRAPMAEPLAPPPPRIYRPIPRALFPPPLSIPKRHSTPLNFSSPSQYSPATPAWARDALPPRRHSATISRTTSVVSKYPHAAEQDYSDIAATNPFDSDNESDFTDDTCFSDIAGDALAESPSSYIMALSTAAPSELQGGVPRAALRFEFDEAGLGLGIGVPGELMEESYEVLEGKLPVLEDKRASARLQRQVGRASTRRASCMLY